MENGKEQWVPLRMMELNYPIVMAEYAASRNVSDDTAFFWWVTYTLRKTIQ